MTRGPAENPVQTENERGQSREESKAGGRNSEKRRKGKTGGGDDGRLPSLFSLFFFFLFTFPAFCPFYFVSCVSPYQTTGPTDTPLLVHMLLPCANLFIVNKIDINNLSFYLITF